ncbi:MAG: chromosomal replication initiator protein DnaA [Clostridia bacterium]|nr:chromosomal replication initiator protein DnaA [Clostridia bacterium]
MTEFTNMNEGKSQLKIVWEKICERLEKVVTPISFETFIRDLEPVDISGRHLVLRAGTDLAAATIISKHSTQIKDAILKYEGGYGLVGFRIIVNGSKVYNLDALEEDDAYHACPINKSFTFSSFVAGAGSKLVYEAAKTVAENPGAMFNPLFIYGESGLGKTHLMHAIANYMAEHAPQKKVLYTTCDKFVTEFIDSLSSQASSARFRQRYRNVDVLMIDDIQFLKDKKTTQEEFFHTFNELSAQNKQIVLTSDKHPQELAILEDRLRTRFAGGMIADIQPPELETKIAILKKKAADRKCPMIPQDVLEFLAKDSGHDVRTLEGRLTKVIFASKLKEEPITLALAQTALSESVREPDEKEELTPERMLSAVCHYYKQRKEDVLGKGKKAEVVKARQICAYLMCEMLSLPLVSIGNILGGRDHTTIMYARDKMEKLVNTSDKTAKEVDDIKSILLKQ